MFLSDSLWSLWWSSIFHEDHSSTSYWERRGCPWVCPRVEKLINSKEIPDTPWQLLKDGRYQILFFTLVTAWPILVFYLIFLSLLWVCILINKCCQKPKKHMKGKQRTDRWRKSPLAATIKILNSTWRVIIGWLIGEWQLMGLQRKFLPLPSKDIYLVVYFLF